LHGPPYWDNQLVGYNPEIGYFSDAPAGSFLNQVNDHSSFAPDQRSNLELIQQEGYPGVTFAQPHAGKPSQDWDFESLRHMGKTADYKGTTPDGYGEQIEYVDGDSKVNTKDWKVGQIEDIKKLGKELASESEHAKILYPNADSLKSPEGRG